MTSPDEEPLAELIVTLLTERGQTVAVAESLTGGLLAASLVEIPGAGHSVQLRAVSDVGRQAVTSFLLGRG